MADIHGRMINTAIWRDDWFLGLRESEQHLFTYLITAPVSSLSGIYQLGLMEAAFHTKVEANEIKRIFAERFQPDKKAFFEVGWVVLKNHLKHQRFNPNQWKAVQSDINGLPEWLRHRLYDPKDDLYIPFETLSKGLLMVPNPSEPLGNSSDQDKISKVKLINTSQPQPEAVEKSKGKRPATFGGNGGGGGKNHLEKAKQDLLNRRQMP
jgi:hypothetical protein